MCGWCVVCIAVAMMVGEVDGFLFWICWCAGIFHDELRAPLYCTPICVVCVVYAICNCVCVFMCTYSIFRRVVPWMLSDTMLYASLCLGSVLCSSLCLLSKRARVDAG